MKITGVRVTGPAAPNPMSGRASEVSSIEGNPGGNVLPTTPAACATAAVKKAVRAAAWRIHGFISRLLPQRRLMMTAKAGADKVAALRCAWVRLYRETR